MGRPRKTEEQLNRGGTFREDRHGKLAKCPKFGGAPAKPPGMSAEADWHWDQVVPELVRTGVVFAADSPALQAMCEQWAAYREARKLDAFDLKEMRQRQMLVNAALRAWRDLAARFGLTPIDRAKIEVAESGEEEDRFAALLAQPIAPKVKASPARKAAAKPRHPRGKG